MDRIGDCISCRAVEIRIAEVINCRLKRELYQAWIVRVRAARDDWRFCRFQPFNKRRNVPLWISLRANLLHAHIVHVENFVAREHVAECVNRPDFIAEFCATA